MSKTGDRSPLLTREDELLLAAAARPGPAGADAWAAYRRRVDPRTVDAPTDHVLPNVYWNLRAQGGLGRDGGLLKGVLRFVWSRNQLALDRLARVLEALAAADIPTLLLDDAALALRYYEHLGLRPIRVARVLIPAKHARAAVERARTLSPSTGLTLADRLRGRRAVRLRPEGRPPVDLCWSLPDPGRSATPIAVRGIPSRALDPTSELLRLLFAAPWADRCQRLGGLLDVRSVLRSARAEIDRPRLVARVAAGPRAAPARAVLRYLHATGAAPVPPDILAERAAGAAPDVGWRRDPAGALAESFASRHDGAADRRGRARGERETGSG